MNLIEYKMSKLIKAVIEMAKSKLPIIEGQVDEFVFWTY